ncbi:unnamed protein product [Mytilus edulis]|uniref:C-type lectin domain-containing protein n=1 Tax=Mytilus edulis TaxID=6550 RepID=A0A8S3SGN1_MYTED|nr:unnamed protein product [Mytilus edulis]
MDLTCHPATSSEYWISKPSKVQCASLCFMTYREQCSAMIWNTLERTCWIIESSEPMTINAGKVMTDLNVYVIPKKVSLKRSKSAMWIGLKAEQWVNGDPFINVFGLLTQFNNYDSKYRSDNETDCTVVYLQGTYVFQDESCNIRVRSNYLCEITMS